MALDPRKRQKKKERRNAKQKVHRRTAIARFPTEMPARLRRAAAAPILHAVAAETLWDQGIGSVLLSRALPNGSVAFGFFLVDVFCCGVKNAIYGIEPRASYREHVYEKAASYERPTPMRPECCRKLVEGAVEYARQWEIAPHADYAKARLIFGDIDAAACPEEFEYGRDGKPFYVSGPYDSPERSRRIIAQLERTAGKGNFDYLVMLKSSDRISEEGGILRLAGGGLADGAYEADEDYEDETEGEEE